MKFTLFFIAILSVTVSYGQVHNFTKATEYNDFIVSEQTRIAKVIQSFNNIFLNTTDTAEIHRKRRDIIAQANDSYKQLLLTEPFRGDTALKKHAQALFAFYAKIAGNEYRQLVDVYYDTKRTDAEKNTQLQQLIKSVTENEKVYDANFQKAQSAFAEKHNIQLTENSFKMNQ